jgi:nucleotide-binding universal stress UspA family protein
VKLKLSIENVLCPLDFSSCSLQSLEYACHKANVNNAKLHLFHTSPRVDFSRNTSAEFPYREQIRPILEKYQFDPDDEERIVLVHRISEGLDMSTSQMILDYGDEINADLIVLGSHSGDNVKLHQIGEVASCVIRDASPPVLAIRQGEAPQPKRPFSEILVPYDFSWHARKALDYAALYAEKNHGTLHLLYVHEKGFLAGLVGGGNNSGLEVFEKQLKQVAEDLDTTAAVKCHASSGKAYQEINKYAEDLKVDVIVMATQGLTGLGRMILGSVTDRVVRSTPCPVLTYNASKAKK